MEISNYDVILIDLIFGGLALNLYIYRPKLAYGMTAVFCWGMALLHFYLMVNRTNLETIYSSFPF